MSQAIPTNELILQGLQRARERMVSNIQKFPHIPPEMQLSGLLCFMAGWLQDEEPAISAELEAIVKHVNEAGY